jgi:hypothetical protein
VKNERSVQGVVACIEGLNIHIILIVINGTSFLLFIFYCVGLFVF